VRARRLHAWDVTTSEARRIQFRLRHEVSAVAEAGFDPRVVAGADVAFEHPRGATRAWAAIVSVRLPDLETIEEASAAAEVGFPYVPGLLSFREMPVLAAAWRRLRRRPDALVVDAHGVAHPRRAGLACHAGLIFELPTIGCAKSILIGTHGRLGRERGAWAPLVVGDEVVGCALRTRTGVKPVYVSVGHRIDLETAREIILRLAARYRLPEPTRRAHRLAGDLKASRVVSRRGARRKHT
jgi:deoxyribonuclease V